MLNQSTTQGITSGKSYISPLGGVHSLAGTLGKNRGPRLLSWRGHLEVDHPRVDSPPALSQLILATPAPRPTALAHLD